MILFLVMLLLELLVVGPFLEELLQHLTFEWKEDMYLSTGSRYTMT